MTDTERIAALEAEVAFLRRVNEEQARALAGYGESAASEGRRRSAAADRQARYRMKKKAESAPVVTPCHVTGDVTRDVTPPSPPLDGSPLPSVPSFPSPLSSPLPPFPSASEGPAEGSRPVLVLEKQNAEPSRAELPAKAERKPSAAERCYLEIQASREATCAEADVPFVPDRWTPPMINKQLGALVKGAEDDRKRFQDAWVCYLGDERHRDKGWPLTLFIHGPVRSRYEAQALREAGGVP